MLQFFQNIWAWIVAQAGAIGAVLDPANLILTAVAFIQLLRQRREIKSNTNNSKELRESLKENAELRKKVGELEAQVEELHKDNTDLKDGMNQCITKLNCVLEVQEKAYGMSLQGTKTLDAINGIIANGKYAETNSRKAIVEEVAEMREQLEKLTEATKASEEKVKRITGVAEAPEAKGVRYD